MEDFVQSIERVQAKFATGLAALEVVQDALDKFSEVNAPTEALYVTNTFLQGVYDDLCASLQAYSQTAD